MQKLKLDCSNTPRKSPQSIYNSPFTNLNGVFPPNYQKEKTAKNFNDFILNKNSLDSYKIKIRQNKNLFSKPLPKIHLNQKKTETSKHFYHYIFRNKNFQLR